MNETTFDALRSLCISEMDNELKKYQQQSKETMGFLVQDNKSITALIEKCITLSNQVKAL